jgi:predicted anti-sigma-YlaC factor YlaD
MLPTCRDMTELSTEYLENTLGWRRRLAVRLHLAICSLCRAYYDQLAKTLVLLRGRPLDGPDAMTETRLLAGRPADEGTGP